ncbi:Gmad2 immunoglobulin-like domain-containing protein [Kribbella sp. NPDC048915]|uniref:Gmad2 immunoglobulin-like domain-containing protein n=1 Tax=Kribbella sp. NPDC048915 TaxID=3155148 RepID=UPI00340A9FD2
MSDNQNDPFDELMRRSLHEEADRIEPSDALPEIRARAHAQRPAARRPWLITAGLAAVGTAAAIGAFTMLNGAHDIADNEVAGPGPEASGPELPGTGPSASPVPSTVPSTAPSTAPSAGSTAGPTAGPTEPAITSVPSAGDTTAPATRGVPEPAVKSAVVPVYWLGQQVGADKTSARLYRTWAKVSGRPAEQAVRIMTSKQPSDPDYFSVWRGAALNTVTRSNDVVTVDFKRLPQGALDRNLARVAVQQLVYTVQGALQDNHTPIRVTEAGRPVGALFGHVDTATPLGRAQAADVQALVWIDSPTEAAAVEPNITVQGVAAAYEATVNYQVTNLKTRETVKSYANTKEGQKFSPFSFRLKLSPGPWELSVYLISPADGSITDTDTKSIVVK